jgi:hypothetical protein
MTMLTMRAKSRLRNSCCTISAGSEVTLPSARPNSVHPITSVGTDAVETRIAIAST